MAIPLGFVPNVGGCVGENYICSHAKKNPKMTTREGIGDLRGSQNDQLGKAMVD